MNYTMRLPRFLNHAAFSFFSVFFSLLNRGILSYYSSHIGNDKRLQLSMAQGLMEGRGLGVTKYSLHDIYSPIFDTTQFFPPGYSVLIIPFLKIFGSNEYLATTALDLIIVITFIIVIRRLCRIIGMSTGVINLITIVMGCFQFGFFLFSTPTDALNLTLLIGCIAHAICLQKSLKTAGYIKLILSGFFFFLPGLFRYASIPIGLILPLLILAYNFFQKDRYSVKKSLFIFFITLFFTGLLFTSLYFYSGNALPGHSTKAGFYPGHLMHWYPFIPASFINLDFAAQRVEQFFQVPYTTAFKMFRIIHEIIFAGLSVWALIGILRHRISLPKTAFGLFVFYGAAISIFTMVILAYMSLSRPLGSPPFFWTFVAEGRYYAFINVFLQIAMIGLITKPAIKKRPFILNLISFFVLITLAIETAHGIYYNAKIISRYEAMKAEQVYNHDYLYFPKLLSELENQFPQHRILVASTNRFYWHTAISNGHIGIFDAYNLDKIPLKVKEKSLLLVAVPYQDYQMLRNYLETKKPKLIATIPETKFYIQELNP